jgi:hypothetical protein
MAPSPAGVATATVWARGQQVLPEQQAQGGPAMARPFEATAWAPGGRQPEGAPLQGPGVQCSALAMAAVWARMPASA